MPARVIYYTARTTASMDGPLVSSASAPHAAAALTLYYIPVLLGKLSTFLDTKKNNHEQTRQLHFTKKQMDILLRPNYGIALSTYDTYFFCTVLR